MARGPGAAANPASAAGRGLLLVVAAIVLGILLLRSTVDDPNEQVSAETTVASETTTSTTVSDTTATTGASQPDGTATTSSTLVVEARPPEEVRVQVLNGNTGVNGAAGALTETIATFNYVTEEADNAIGPEAAQVSYIYFEAGYRAEANRLAGELGWDVATAVQAMPQNPLSEEPPDPPANLLVLLGLDHAAPAGT